MMKINLLDRLRFMQYSGHASAVVAYKESKTLRRIRVFPTPYCRVKSEYTELASVERITDPMFKCFAGHVTEPGVKCTTAPTEVRSVVYRDHDLGPIGRGYETVREEKFCPEHQGGGARVVGFEKTVVEPKREERES